MKTIDYLPLPLFGLSRRGDRAPTTIRANKNVFVPLFTSAKNLDVFLQRTALELEAHELPTWGDIWKFATAGASMCDEQPPTAPPACWFVIDPVELSGEICRPYPADRFLEAVKQQLASS